MEALGATFGSHFDETFRLFIPCGSTWSIRLKQDGTTKTLLQEAHELGALPAAYARG